jgi:hypothetical protein
MAEQMKHIFVDNAISVAVHDDVVRITLGRRGPGEKNALEPVIEVAFPKGSVTHIVRALTTVR